MSDLVKRQVEMLRKQCTWQRSNARGKEDYPYRKHYPDCDICRSAELIEKLQADKKELAISVGRMKMMLLDERGGNRGKTCWLCNMLERSACYENTEKLETTIEQLQEACGNKNRAMDELCGKIEQLQIESNSFESVAERLADQVEELKQLHATYQ